MDRWHIIHWTPLWDTTNNKEWRYGAIVLRVESLLSDFHLFFSLNSIPSHVLMSPKQTITHKIPEMHPTNKKKKKHNTWLINQTKYHISLYIRGAFTVSSVAAPHAWNNKQEKIKKKCCCVFLQHIQRLNPKYNMYNCRNSSPDLTSHTHTRTHTHTHTHTRINRQHINTHCGLPPAYENVSPLVAPGADSRRPKRSV